MISVNVNVTNNMNEATSGVYNAIVDSMEKVSGRMLLQAKQFCPVDTGLLRSEIKLKNGKLYFIIYVRGVNYAIYVEATQPFLRAALYSNLPYLKQTINESIGRVLN